MELNSTIINVCILRRHQVGLGAWPVADSEGEEGKVVEGKKTWVYHSIINVDWKAFARSY